MKNLRWTPVYFALFSLFLGCGGPVRIKKKLILSLDEFQSGVSPTLKLPGGKKIKIRIKELKLHPLYDNAKVVTRTGDYTIKYNSKGNWAVRPNILITRLAQDFLSKKIPGIISV